MRIISKITEDGRNQWKPQIPQRLDKQLDEQKGEAKLAVLESEQEFWSLIWLQQKGSRILTPDGACHKMNSVVERAIAFPWEELNKGKGLSPEEQNPKWFTRTLDVERQGVDLSLMKTVALTPSKVRDASLTELSIYEGQHRMLALAKQLRSGIAFIPFTILLLLPGRDFRE